MTDPLQDWWQHEVIVERFTGNEYDSYAPAETLLGFVADGTKLVPGPGGQTVVSSAQVALPNTTAYVPVDSRVTLPALFGSRITTVLVASVGDAGAQPTPNHIELALL